VDTRPDSETNVVTNTEVSPSTEEKTAADV
jgi:hypothetical protein